LRQLYNSEAILRVYPLRLTDFRQPSAPHAAAMQTFAVLQRRCAHPDLLTSRDAEVLDMGKKGVWRRARRSPLALIIRQRIFVSSKRLATTGAG
jgi:hypothetical protein